MWIYCLEPKPGAREGKTRTGKGLSWRFPRSRGISVQRRHLDLMGISLPAKRLCCRWGNQKSSVYGHKDLSILAAPTQELVSQSEVELWARLWNARALGKRLEDGSSGCQHVCRSARIQAFPARARVPTKRRNHHPLARLGPFALHLTSNLFLPRFLF